MRKIEIPLPELAPETVAEHYDGRPQVTVFIRDGKGAMRRFREYADAMRHVGYRVEFKQGGDRRPYPMIDVESDDFEVTVFGPEFTPEDLNRPAPPTPIEIGEAIERAVEREDGEQLDAAVDDA